jgi:hypothetical protein
MNSESDQSFKLAPDAIYFDKITGSTYFRSHQHPLLVGLKPCHLKNLAVGKREEINLSDCLSHCNVLSMSLMPAYL